MGSILDDHEQPSQDDDNALRNKKQAPIVESIDGMQVFRDAQWYDLITAYFHFGADQSLINCDFILPDDVIWVITTFSLQELIIDSKTKCTLGSGAKYSFGKVHLKPYSVLTVNKWDVSTKEGGILWIDCSGDFIVDKGASVNLSGRGYSGNIEHSNISQPCMTHAEFEALMNYNSIRKKNQKNAEPNDYNNNTNYRLFKENNVRIGDGIHSGEYFGGNGGGYIHISCRTLTMDSAYILAMGSKSFRFTKGDGGYIDLDVAGQARVSGRSKILTTQPWPTMAMNKAVKQPASKGNGGITIHCSIDDKHVFIDKVWKMAPIPEWKLK